MKQPSTWATFGASTARLGQAAASAPVSNVARRFVLPLSGRFTAQVLSAEGVFVAASTGGDVVAFDRNGFVLWRDQIGQLAHSCPQLDGYGVVGTGVIDQTSGTFYVADAFGRLHALALATGAERPGWPVRVFTDVDSELNWGALTLARGSVYVPTAAYCDTAGTPGGIYRVNLATRAVSHWLAVPLDQGGGGGPWGWGGLAFDSASGGLFAGSSGAFAGGSNTGASYTETAGYGDRLIDFGPDLQVRASSHPAGLPDRQDLDFVGSPLLVPGTSCGPLVVAATKNDAVYGWSEGDLAQGWVWKVAIEPYAIGNPFVSQLAWSSATSSVYAVTGHRARPDQDRRRVQALGRLAQEARNAHRERLADRCREHGLVRRQRQADARRLRRDQRQAAHGGAARGHDAGSADRRRGPRDRGDVQRHRRRVRHGAGAPSDVRDRPAVIDELGRCRARLAGTSERRVRDGRWWQPLEKDLVAAGARRAARLRDVGSGLDGLRSRCLHVRDEAVVDDGRRPHLARHADAERGLRRQRRPRLLLAEGQPAAARAAAGAGDRRTTRGAHGRIGGRRDDRVRDSVPGWCRRPRVESRRRRGVGQRPARDHRPGRRRQDGHPSRSAG